jgi:hypothetical protein
MYKWCVKRRLEFDVPIRNVAAAACTTGSEEQRLKSGAVSLKTARSEPALDLKVRQTSWVTISTRGAIVMPVAAG